MGVIIPNPTVATEDGATSVSNVKKIEVTDGTLTDDGLRVVSITTGGSSAAGSTYDVQFNDGGSLAAGSLQFMDGSAHLILNRTPAGNSADILGGKNPDDEGVDIQIRALADDGGSWTSLYLAGEKGGDGGTLGAYLLTVDGEGLNLETGIIQSNGAGTDIMLNAASGVVNIYSASETPILQINDDSNRVDLECVANKKLRIRGGAGGNTFDFDVSSATGGITFPDATTQITAASGGGGDGYSAVQFPADGFATGFQKYYVIGSTPPWGTQAYQTYLYGTWTTYVMFYPFIAPYSGDIEEFNTYVQTAPGTGTWDIGVYTDDGGLPKTLLGEGSVDVSATGFRATTSFTSTITTVKGTQYWLGFAPDFETGSGNQPTMRNCSNSDRAALGPTLNIANTGYGNLQNSSVTTNATIAHPFTDTGWTMSDHPQPRLGVKYDLS